MSPTPKYFTQQITDVWTSLKVAFTLWQITPRKMVVFYWKNIFIIIQIAKSMTYYAA